MDGWVSVSLSWAITFLTQTGVGILGNLSLLFLHNCAGLTAQTRPTDLILSQLLLANTLVLLSKGIPQTMAAFGLRPSLGEAGCKFVFCFHRVARGVVLSTTCLLSAFPAVTLCFSVSGRLELRMRPPRCVVSCCCLCWPLPLVLNVRLAMRATEPQNGNDASVETMYAFCCLPPAGRQVLLVSALGYLFLDALCLGLRVYTSSSVVLVLRRHRQRVRYMRGSRLSPSASCEARASNPILVLVSVFLSFYALSAVLSFWITRSRVPSRWLVGIFSLASLGFSPFSPFAFLFRDPRTSRCATCWTRKTGV